VRDALGDPPHVTMDGPLTPSVRVGAVVGARRGTSEISEQIEIFPVLPVADRGGIRSVGGLAAALELGLLEVQIVAHEGLAEAGAQAGAPAQRRERLFQRRRQSRG